MGAHLSMEHCSGKKLSGQGFSVGGATRLYCVDRLLDGLDGFHDEIFGQKDLSHHLNHEDSAYALCRSGRDVHLEKLVEEMIGRDDETPLHCPVDTPAQRIQMIVAEIWSAEPGTEWPMYIHGRIVALGFAPTPGRSGRIGRSF